MRRGWRGIATGNPSGCAAPPRMDEGHWKRDGVRLGNDQVCRSVTSPHPVRQSFRLRRRLSWRTTPWMLVQSCSWAILTTTCSSWAVPLKRRRCSAVLRRPRGVLRRPRPWGFRSWNCCGKTGDDGFGPDGGTAEREDAEGRFCRSKGFGAGERVLRGRSRSSVLFPWFPFGTEGTVRLVFEKMMHRRIE